MLLAPGGSVQFAGGTVDKEKVNAIGAAILAGKIDPAAKRRIEEVRSLAADDDCCSSMPFSRCSSATMIPATLLLTLFLITCSSPHSSRIALTKPFLALHLSATATRPYIVQLGHTHCICASWALRLHLCTLHLRLMGTWGQLGEAIMKAGQNNTNGSANLSR